MKKKLFTLLAAGVMGAVMMTGCAKTAAPAESVQETEITTSGDSEAAGTEEVKSGSIVIKHSKGETEVPVNPGKVVVFDMGTLDTIDALGVTPELAVPVGSLPAYLSKYETAGNAGGIKEPDLDAIFEFEPEVIFISGRQSDYYDKLNEIAPTVYVDLNTANYMDDFHNNVINIGAVFGKSEEAEIFLAEVDKKVEDVKAMAAESDKKALIILTNDGSISAYGKGSRFGILHDVLGISTADENIEVSTHGQEVNFEYISEINPDLLFVVDRAVVVGGSTLASQTLNNDLVNETNAAKNDKIVYLDPDTWYLSGGGIQSVVSMIEEVEAALK